MLALFGWIVWLALMVYFSFQCFLLLWWNMGDYNPIGGSKNTIGPKIITVVICIFNICGWIMLAKNAPFTIIF